MLSSMSSLFGRCKDCSDERVQAGPKQMSTLTPAVRGLMRDDHSHIHDVQHPRKVELLDYDGQASRRWDVWRSRVVKYSMCMSIRQRSGHVGEERERDRK